MNQTVIVKDTERKSFDAAFHLIGQMLKPYNKPFKFVGYKIIDNVLFLHQYSSSCNLFAYEFNVQQATEFAWGWWENNQKPNDDEPDTDGSTKVAFEVSTENCGTGSRDWTTVVSIKPIWFIYGK